MAALQHAEQNLNEDEKETAIHVEIMVQRGRLMQKIRDMEGTGERAAGADARMPATVLGATDGCDEAVGGMPNEQLALELLMNPRFQLNESRKSEKDLVHTRVAEVFDTAFWEDLVQDFLDEGSSYRRVLSVLTEVKTGIEALAAGYSEALQIVEIIDIDLITQKISRNALGYDGCERLIDDIFKVIISMHKRLQKQSSLQVTVEKWEDLKQMLNAPGSDDFTKAHIICAALKLIMDRVHCVRVDTANHKLKAIAPVINEHGVSYLRNKFDKKLADQVFTLECTNAWISHAFNQHARGPTPRVHEEDLSKGNAQAFERLLDLAMVDLVAEYPHWGGTTRDAAHEGEIPETMLLDLLRVRALNTHFHADVVSSVILATVEEKLRDLVCDDKTRAGLVKAAQDVVLKNVPNPGKLVRTIDLVMADLRSRIDDGALAEIKITLLENVKKDSSKYADMVNVFKRAWYDLITIFKLSGQYMVPDAAIAVIVASQARLTEFKKMVMVNRRVHVGTYNKVIAKAVKGEAQAS